jgi:NAD(P)-dependent dehydrogenase (short-subunit alcohol dehydrogenase family)
MGFLYSQFFKTPPYPKGNFSGKTVVVTGSNVGLGKEAARHYARMGASKLILAVRSLDKGEAAKQDIKSTTRSNCDIQVWKLDMASYDSVKAFAKKANAELERVDIFIANAGVARGDYHTAEGHEEGITVNVISTFLLMALVMPKMKETARKFNTHPTFTLTGSGAYLHTTFPQRDAPNILAALSDKDTVKKHFADQYPVSKLVQLLIVRALAEQHPADKFPVTINITNPGLCHSELARDSPGWGFWLFKLIVARSTEVGSRTLVHAGACGPETHGQYLSDCAIEEPSKLVTDAAGRRSQESITAEVLKELESIEPGCTKNF